MRKPSRRKFLEGFPLEIQILRPALFLFRGFRAEFQNFAGLTFERFADGLERRETDGFGLTGFEDGQILRRDADGVGEVVQPHFALREHYIEIDYDGHNLKPSILVPPEFSALRP